MRNILIVSLIVFSLLAVNHIIMSKQLMNPEGVNGYFEDNVIVTEKGGTGSGYVYNDEPYLRDGGGSAGSGNPPSPAHLRNIISKITNDRGTVDARKLAEYLYNLQK